MKFSKKMTILVVLLISLCTLSGCYIDYYHNSLSEYAKLAKMGAGHSTVSIDRPDYFLPSNTFIEDFEYIDGGFFYYEESIFRVNRSPEVCLLFLKYDSATYLQAKEFMLTTIPKYGEEEYKYNDYIFFENGNFVGTDASYCVPTWFTMACYNDTKQTLVFIGLYSRKDLQYQDLTQESNWKNFIDYYYGKYYDFSA